MNLKFLRFVIFKTITMISRYLGTSYSGMRKKIFVQSYGGDTRFCISKRITILLHQNWCNRIKTVVESLHDQEGWWGGCLKIKSYRYIIESYKNRTICKLFYLWCAYSKRHEFHMIYKIEFHYFYLHVLMQ